MEDCRLDALPDEIVVAVASTLTKPRELLALSAVSHHFRALPTSPLWRALCEACWQPWPRYRLTPTREAWLHKHKVYTDYSWQARYRHFQSDAARTTLTAEEMRDLSWHFNFTVSAGGRGRATLKPARFSETKLYVPGYPPLDYSLVDLAIEAPDVSDDAKCGSSGSGSPSADLQQVSEKLQQMLGITCAPKSVLGPTTQMLQINSFPPHIVERLASSREWLVYNDNVTFVSCVSHEEGPGSWDERGFLTDLVNPHLAA